MIIFIVIKKGKEKMTFKKGNHFSLEVEKKRIESIRRNPSHGMLGKHHTEETKHKMSLTRKGISKSEEHKRKLGLAKLGEKNPKWKGDKVGWDAGHCRAIRKFQLKPCEICGSIKSERHHKDGNYLNNSPENIQFLCRHHHMLIDKRTKIRYEKMKKEGEDFHIL